MEEEVFTISITVSQPAAKIDGTVEIVDDYGLSIVASQQGVALEGVTMSEISQTALIAFGQWYKGDTGQQGPPGPEYDDTEIRQEIAAKYTKPGTGIPKSDLSDGVQASLDLADSAIQEETDPTVPSWAKAAQKPSYDYSEIGNTPTIPAQLDDLTDVEIQSPTNGQGLIYDGTKWGAGNVDALPSQTGNAGKFLTTDGTDASWEEVQDTSFVCNFTITSLGETEQRITCDKSIAEIIAAAQSGKEVRGFAGDGSSTDFLVTMSAFEEHYVAFQSTIVVFGAHLVYFTGDDSTNTDVWSGGVFSYSSVAFSGDYQDLRNKPTLGTASTLDVAESGNASTTQVVKGDDTRLSDNRNAADVYPWAKASTKPSYTASEVGAIASSEKGSNNGVAELDATGKVPSSQLPSYVDDVLEYASLSAFPATGESGKIYIALDTNKTYRWGGSTYVEISESLALGETSTTAYAGNKGKANADAIAAIKDGSTIDSFADVETALAYKADLGDLPPTVSGTNDGTNWTAITIGSSTFGVPSIPSNISAFTNDAGYVPKSNIVGIGFADTNKILVSDDVTFTSYGASDYSTNFILICGKQVTLNSSSTRKFYRLNGAYTNYTFENNLTISTGVYKAVLSDGVFALTTIPDTYSVNSLIETAISQIQTGVPEIHSHDAGKVMTVNSNEDGYELVNPNSLCSLSSLSDVTLGGLLSNGNILQWDSSSSKWVNAPAPTGTIPSPTTSNTYLYSPDGSNLGWTTIGSITGHDLTHIANTTVSTSSTTITFAANTRGSQMITVSDDIDIAFVVNNNSDNYLWIENSDSANNIDVTISSVTHNGNVVSNVRMPRDGIVVPAGGTCEIGIVCNTDGAFITSRDDLE